MPTKNYCYRCWPLDGAATSSVAQMTAAHAYRNKLVELERGRREAVAQVLAELCPEYVAAGQAVTDAEAAIEAKIAAIRAERKKQRAKQVEAKEIRAAIAEDRAQLKELRAARKAIKAESFDRLDVKAALAATSVAHNDAAKLTRKNSGCYWGTYLIVEESADKFGKGPPPRFERWRGDGAIAVQIQGGMTADDLYAGDDTRAAIEYIIGGQGNRQARVLRLRIGSDDKKKPIWARFRILLHRPLPDGAVVKWLRVMRRLVGTQVQWQAMFTLVLPEGERSPASEEMVAVHAGWRMLPDRSLRVAVWRGSDGRRGELTIPASELAAAEHVAGLRSVCDTWFETARRRLKAWLIAAEKRGVKLPEWLAKETETLHAWRNHRRLADLAQRWEANGFAGDERIVRYLVWWRVRKDRHLSNWAVHRLNRIHRRRDDAFRCLVARLAEQYQSVAVLKVNWKSLGEKQTADRDDDDAPAVIRRYARLASPGRLHQFLREKFGGTVVDVDPAQVTAECHRCGKREKWNRIRLRHQCSGCLVEWDQDDNAAINQLARAKETLVGAGDARE